MEGYDSVYSSSNSSTRTYQATTTHKSVNNIITTRGNNLYYNMQSLARSRNMADANIKSLRLFRKICRMMPWLINMHQFYGRINVEQAKSNVADHFRQKAHLNKP
eukprot:TRINITY_DN83272_c0_g1_i1.p2 TRINITY_DN83272_c0_g1~~TRINITY_DN83272_c0_g1_i1.p2  ORF type:complete len:105 (-),score=11.24 TRINITY_DN83272_c0_g1_i1:41-355(-)